MTPDATNATALTANPPNQPVDAWPRWMPFLLVAFVAACLGVIRLTSPPNLLDQDQERPATYVLDAVKNGNWICQRDLSGDITSKPPLYTWLCAALSVANGRISLATLYLPCVFAGFGVAWMLLAVGRKYFGTTAAMFGALMFMLTPAGLKSFGLARTDSVFTLTVTAAALLAWCAWNRGSGWTWFWLVAALATLTKGPLGVVLASFGLLAAVWERRSGVAQPVKGSHWPGVVLFFLITAGWFYLAYLDQGQALIDKMIGKELVGNAIKNKKDNLPGTLIWQQPLYYLGRAAPWSLLAYYGVWRICKRPSKQDEERRFERFLCCWFLAGLFLFSLSPHQRADLLWPLMPAASLIAGRELSRFTRHLDPIRVRNGTLVGVTVMVMGFGVYYYFVRERQPVIQRTIALQKLAAKIEAEAGAEPPLTFVDAPAPRLSDAPPALQVYLNVYRRPVTAQRAAALLRGGDAAFVALDDLSMLDFWRKPEDPPLFTLLAGEDGSGLKTKILGNRPTFWPQVTYAFACGPFDVRVKNARPLQVAQHRLCVRSESEACSVTISNTVPIARSIRVDIVRGGRYHTRERVLAANEAWTVTIED